MLDEEKIRLRPTQLLDQQGNDVVKIVPTTEDGAILVRIDQTPISLEVQYFEGRGWVVTSENVAVLSGERIKYSTEPIFQRLMKEKFGILEEE
jgi:hypothetical protein